MQRKGVSANHLTKPRGVTIGLLTGIFIFLCLVPASSLFGGTAPVDKPVGDNKEAPASQVWVTYYYTSYRCPTCMKLETYSRQAVEGGFPDEIEKGQVVFRTLNLDEPENSRFVDEYKLVTKSLIVSLNRKGREVKWKNLPDIWKLVGDQEKFEEYVRRETQSFLKER